MPDATLDGRAWLAEQFESLPTELEVMSPSTWAEAKRYLPPQVTSMPGFYRFEVAPYLREIVDCLSVDSPIREVTIQKGVQLGFTVGVLENAIGYYIEHVRSAPVMMVTADAELAKLRMDSYVTPMIQHSGLEHLIKSSDEKNPRKTGKTDKKIEWVGGGFLIPFGAQNANKLRSISILAMLRDEIDGWPDIVGKDGDPLKLTADRTAAYEAQRKILDISTPLIKGLSKIEPRFLAGDQRRYFVCCLSCGFSQVLRFRHTNPETGEITGIVWETERGILVPSSVRYLCRECGHAHFNDDKTRLLAPENGAEWRPTAEPQHPYHRSYHISALYSPVGMQTWEACVRKWIEAWDDDRARPLDLGKLQVFYNNVLGETYELRGEKVRFENVSQHRRSAYTYGEVPNEWAKAHAGGFICMLVCQVDVHKDKLAVSVKGWTRGRRVFLIDYWDFEGTAERLDDPGTWGRLRQLIEQPVAYEADDGKKYPIALTVIDSGYMTDQVYRFCADYETGVLPIKGRESAAPNSAVKEFSEFKTSLGTRGFGVTVPLYKDRWAAALRRTWDGQSIQPELHFNAPLDVTDEQLKQLTRETKREKRHSITKKLIGHEWHRPSGSANELWDLLVYASAALDIVAWDVCRQLGMDFVSMTAFFDEAEQGIFFRE